MINTNTKNKSFKEMRNILYDYHVNNSDFMLELKDDTLIDLPENPKLWNPVIRKKVVRECQNNFWFFVREIIRIPSNSNIAYKDSYEYCNRFKLRIDTLRLFYGYLNDISIVYLTKDEDAIYEAIAVLMIYEYLIREPSLYPNYDNTLPDKLLNIINNILELNSYTLFFDNFGNKPLVREYNKDDGMYVNKFIFDLSNLNLHKSTNIYDIYEKIICLDRLYEINTTIGLNGMLRDSTLKFVEDTIKPYTGLFNLFDMEFPKNNIDGSHLYVKPIYSIDNEIKGENDG